MKIFANNFALSFRLQEAQPHFRFERGTWETTVERLRQNPAFQDQVWYVDVTESLSPALVFALHTDAQINGQRTELGLVFSHDGERKQFLDAYLGMFKLVPAAGGLVIGPGPALLMILRDGKWDLPKGKVEIDEEIDAAAWREVAEETGLNAHRMGEKATETYHIFERGGKWRFKVTHWYWMEMDVQQALVPQTEEGITEVRWWGLDELSGGIPETYPQIMGLARLAIASR